MNRIGSDQVIVVRNKNAGTSVLLNSCRHRGNAVCRAEQGNTRTFLCPYHGWSYALNGELVGVPGLRDFYRNDLKKDELGLGQAAQVSSYKGFVFATMDPDAVPLEEYLGDVGRVGLDIVAERGDMEVVDGIQKNLIDCNWKLAVDNLFDWYHPSVSHKSAIMADVLPGLSDEAMSPMKQMVMLGEYGHAIGGPRATHEELAAAREPGCSSESDTCGEVQARPREDHGPCGCSSVGPSEHLSKPLDHLRRQSDVLEAAQGAAANGALVVHVRRQERLRGVAAVHDPDGIPRLWAGWASRAGRRGELAAVHARLGRYPQPSISAALRHGPRTRRGRPGRRPGVHRDARQ